MCSEQKSAGSAGQSYYTFVGDIRDALNVARAKATDTRRTHYVGSREIDFASCDSAGWDRIVDAGWQLLFLVYPNGRIDLA